MHATCPDDIECRGVFSSKQRAEDAKKIAIERMKARHKREAAEIASCGDELKGSSAFKSETIQHYNEMELTGFYVGEIMLDCLYDWQEQEDGSTKFVPIPGNER